jgi:hypothetical protein
MLRLEVSTRSEGTLEARGIFGASIRVSSENGRVVCDPELALSCVEDWRMKRNLVDYRRPYPR